LNDHATALEEKIRANTARIGTIGLGYVGLPSPWSSRAAA
jgi:UDP-N-acetyl-D-mannosaminuronate dehydrogenase